MRSASSLLTVLRRRLSEWLHPAASDPYREDAVRELATELAAQQNQLEDLEKRMNAADREYARDVVALATAVSSQTDYSGREVLDTCDYDRDRLVERLQNAHEPLAEASDVDSSTSHSEGVS